MKTSYVDFSNDGWFDRRSDGKRKVRQAIEILGLVYTFGLIAINSLVFHDRWMGLPWTLLPYLLFVPVYLIHGFFSIRRDFWPETETSLGTVVGIDQLR